VVRSRSYLFLIIIVLPLFEHGPRRTSGRSLKLRSEGLLTLIRRMTENCSKTRPKEAHLTRIPARTRQTRGSCTSVPQILVHCSQMIQSWLACAKARQRSQFQSLGKASASNSPNVEKSTARSCASQSADKSHPAGHYAVPLDSSLCEH
jgi:hypothetical protein